MTCLDAALRDLRYSHMTARTASINSMRSGKSFSQERQDPVKIPPTQASSMNVKREIFQ